MLTRHARVRMQQRCIPSAVFWLLEDYGEAAFDGVGGVRRYFSHRSVRAIERELGSEPLRRLSRYLNVYKVEDSSSGLTITVGHRSGRIRRKRAHLSLPADVRTGSECPATVALTAA